MDLTVPAGKLVTLDGTTSPPKSQALGADVDVTGKVPLPLALREVEPPRADKSPDDSWRVPGVWTTKRAKGFEPLGQLEVVVVPPGQIHRGWRPFALFGMLAVLGIGSGWAVIAKADRMLGVKLAPALAVRTPLKAGTRVLPEMLVEVKLPVELAKSIVPPEQIALVAMQPLQVNVEGGEPLRWWQFQVAHGPDDLSQRINLDYRAFALEVEEKSAVGFHLRPGDRVDVIAVLAPHGDATQRTAFLAAQNLTVLVTGGQHPVPGLQGSYRDLSLLVSPQDAERLALVRAKGKFAFALRGPNDTDTIDGVKLNSTGMLELELKGGAKAR
jgi:Flp pilus assembly protein CpaB